MRSFQLLDHTADALVRARGDSLGELLVACAEGLFAVIVEDGEVRHANSVAIELEADSAEELVHGWLRELVYRCSAEGWVFARFDVRRATPTDLHVVCHGETLDPARHRGAEVKAVTWHGFRVDETPDGWVADVLFDI